MALVGHAPSDFGGDLARKPCFMGKSFSKSLRHVLDIIGNGQDHKGNGTQHEGNPGKGQDPDSEAGAYTVYQYPENNLQIFQ